ncbi:Vps45, SM superfamily protein [Emiliania huxleyi CCMP1516]|uniref:Vacuolar protein sorting-associated protein 45 n=2 Tax=Emiliania huxleyi TaxID=2903 RepID=A0A0D3KXE6_EMIH1|nr:Vps45, SM superfamily protein [Emiliania huxleyi CCMP1516]EOD40431.1 Vps45, SM superfamily protein [Emiliania huxleyi CCMP1516]|mmetsp:Transcript_818/g.2438  ORF Transcript_818/g.2438 Transcript_818/m.2438 type:complete len:622 (+) Transcript_818:57-1922(+)|eukprot:CAMPEP_0196715788 /NCGR_PEP_ID=MMETSP1090-20130531/76385_1 /TAXON_ID=37098 /ORGANISM="Isochrysis sp, Strain CCMP1244" /LENGTH=621 /DNA_ID=CAMNT_0042055893 /DNA_START=1072 /DNA_END=2937 /DNA_ORIENTATION=+
MASSSVARSNTIQTVRDYVTRMCTDVPGMKVLVMDAETTGVVSMVFTQTQVLQHEVFMTDTIERQAGEKMPHLKACYFVRPTAENLRRIQSELREPRFGEYHLFFSNTTRDGMIQQLAEADEHEVVQQVHEYFADYLPVTPDLFHLNVGSIAGLSGSVWEQAVFDRLHQGVCSLLLSLKKRPQIRYQRSSEVAQRVAETVLGTMDADPDLFAFRRPDVPPLLLIVDRRDDPVTPLLSQWTYQAMVHELVGISNNRVDLRGAPGVDKELQQLVLSADQDAFFADNMLLNYGDLAENVKGLLDAFQAKTKSTKNIGSIADMQQFVEAYPQFKKLSGDVSKHVTLLGEINRLVESQQLMEVSQVEQELACTEDHSSAVTEVLALLRKPSIADQNKLRLVLLYALRYEKEPSNRIDTFCDMLGADARQAVSQMLAHCGAAVRSGDLFSNKTWLAATKKSLQRNIKGVQNVYTQHSPYLAQTLDALLKGTLTETQYPHLGSEPPTAGAKRRAPVEVIVFMVGGVTYEESRYVSEMNTANPGVRVLLGGTTIHNSASFLEEVKRLPSAGGAPTPQPMQQPGLDSLTGGLSGLGIAAPSIDSKRIKALTSTMSSSLQSGVSTLASKIQ